MTTVGIFVVVTGSLVIGFGGSLLMEWYFQRKARRAGVSLARGYLLAAQLDAKLNIGREDD